MFVNFPASFHNSGMSKVVNYWYHKNSKRAEELGEEPSFLRQQWVSEGHSWYPLCKPQWIHAQIITCPGRAWRGAGRAQPGTALIVSVWICACR